MGIEGVNLREELERATGTMEASRQLRGVSLALRALLLLAVAALTTIALGGALRSRAPDAVVGGFVVNLLLFATMAAALRTFRPTIYYDRRALALLTALAAVMVLAAAGTLRIRPGSPELVPIAFVGIVVSALFDRRVGLLTVVLLTVLIAAQPAFREPASLPVLLAAGTAAALAVRETRSRDQSYLWIIIVAAVTSVAIVSAGVAASAPRGYLLAGAIRAVATSVVAVIGAMLFLPMAERISGRETQLTLLEWGDPHHPLLQRLSLEAPGTYAHTVAIANMAEAACRAIGANALLARVGAYYHDIGKLVKPLYFVENQPRGRNPHDKLKPGTSASIIRNHVREGLELADSVGLPASIRAFITEHHGTNTIAYFMERARERDGALLNPAEFTYPGPVPQSAETAVVMLADGAEAAARSLGQPTPERVREVIDHMVSERLEQGQLRDTPLTLRQLTLVKREFARVLGGMYHARVEYPTPAAPTTTQSATI
ncbi:MAG: metal dependent phosphohydrolase [Gemmatimonadetes bacterium]|nr:metal dependent phosphohydrolase [Gemmatimonadota bacterium]